MAWERLREDYVDAVFEGLRKYQLIENPDGSYSFSDVTPYAVRENAFIGAKDINAMNTAMNIIMAALNSGTDLYDVFTRYFEIQKQLFTETADNQNDEFQAYLDLLKKTYAEDIAGFKENQEEDYNKWYAGVQDQCEELQQQYILDITQFKEVKEAAFNEWFTFIKAQLTTDAAGKLLAEILRVEQALTEFIDSEMTAEEVNELYDSVKI